MPKRIRPKPPAISFTADELTAIGQWAWTQRDNEIVASIAKKVLAYIQAKKPGRRGKPGGSHQA